MPATRLSRRRVLAAVGAAAGAAAGLRLVSAAADLLALRRQQRARAQASHQWVMVIDLRRCEGCTTINKPPQCIEACRGAHFLPDGQQWIRVVEETDSQGGSFYRPIPCMQCENAPCVNVCPVGATYHNENGVVLVDQTRCIGCRMCMAACPYDARVFNWTEPPVPEGFTHEDYTPEYPVPQFKGTVSKCMLCAHRVPQGELPACSAGCPMQAIYVGDLVTDAATNGHEVVRLSRFLTENHAYRYRDELGTRPRVYYIPGHGEAFGRRALA